MNTISRLGIAILLVAMLAVGSMGSTFAQSATLNETTMLPIEEQLASIMSNMVVIRHATIDINGYRTYEFYISPVGYTSVPKPTLVNLIDGETYWIRMKNADLLDYTNSEGNRYVYSLPVGVSQLVWQPNNPFFTITGVVTEANGSPVVNATISIDNEQNVVTNEEGLYACSMSYGEHTVTASLDGYKPQSQVILCTENTTLSFCGTNSLVPNAPDKEYVLECINLWLCPDNPVTQLPLEKVLAIINAYLYPR